MRNLIERLKQHPCIFDGAMGTMIYEKGVFINTCFEEVNLTRPSLIAAIHRQYIGAGAEVIETNTFGANRIKLGSYGLAEKAGEMIRAAVACAREQAGSSVYVAGSVGPCTRPGESLTSADSPKAVGAFQEHIAHLCDAGADCILLETFSKLDELALALDAAAACPLPLIACFAVDEGGASALGTPATAFVRLLDGAAHVGAIGINCGVGPAGAFDAVEQLIGLSSKPFIVMPNAGMPREVNGRMIYLTSPEYFATYACRYIELGARGVGGCCGTTPAHIAELTKSIKGVRVAARHLPSSAVQSAVRCVAAVPVARRSALAQKLYGGATVTSIELLPPRSIDLTQFIARAQQCKNAGIDAINIPDGPRASTRVSPMIAAIIMAQKAGIEPVLHYCCRDRNLLGMQADILGAAAAGVANLLCITGDPPKLGDYPNATGVFDVDSIGLTQMAANLNHGIDIGKNPVDPPTALFIGVGANPCAVDIKRELGRFRQKIEAGAEFVITQPVFDAGALLRFLDEARKIAPAIPVIAGVWPLVSYRNAEFMNNEVPGVVIAPNILRRMSACATREAGLREGILIAQEIIAQITPRVQGFQISAPFGKVELALAVLGKAELPAQKQ